MTDKQTKNDDLDREGERKAKQHEEEHIAREKELQAEIDKLTKQLNAKTEQNKNEETKLIAQFESADKMYSEAIDQYDSDLQNHNNELAEYNKEYDEQAHELKQLQEEWAHRQEERRKTEEIQ